MVTALHHTTIEVTTEDHLTPRGDCIIGVSATSGCKQLDEDFKTAMRKEGARVLIRILVEEDAFTLSASGHPALDLSHPRDIVIRRSEFLSDRTLAVRASASAKDIPRRIVSRLKSNDASGKLEIQVF